MKLLIFAGAFCFALAAQALELDLAKEMPTGLSYSLGDIAADAHLKSLPALAQMKYFETRKKALDCNRIAPALFTRERDLRGWIALSWLRCNVDQTFQMALDKVGQNPDLFSRGQWSQNLWELWEDQSMDLIEGLLKRKNAVSAEKHIQGLLNFSDRLTRDDHSQLFRWLGDLAQQKKNYAKALFYNQESLSWRETPVALDKIRFLKKALNLPLTAKEQATPVAANGDNLVWPEDQIVTRMEGALKTGESLAALQDAVELLNSYPGSRAARHLKNKPLDIYSSLSDRPDLIDAGVPGKALEIMGGADATRLADWASTLHRRADYEGARTLAEKALVGLAQSAQSTQLLWIAGRSSEFLGDYDRAMKFFDQLALKNRGTDEAAEALFRMGLIQFRLKNDATAVALFEKVLAANKDRYELSAKYWMYRALAREKNVRAAEVSADIAQLYPFSYYGLRLRAEANKNKIAWPTPVVADSTGASASTRVWLEGDQVGAWKRFVKLLKAGWVNEAQNEIQGLPRPQNLKTQILMAEKLSSAGLTGLAIRWINEALDEDSSLRTKDVMAFAFPTRFKDIYIKEGARNDLNARLLMSLTRQESAFNPRAVSGSNAYGLMQLIPPTAQEVAQKLGYKKFNIPDDLFRPEINIAMGSFYVADMLHQFDDAVPFALAAYNAGPARMNAWITNRTDLQALMQTPSSQPEDEIWFDELPWSETSFYVKAILRNTLIYRLLEEGEFDLSPVIWSDLVIKKTVAQ